jgi:hypothetical protein
MYYKMKSKSSRLFHVLFIGFRDSLSKHHVTLVQYLYRVFYFLPVCECQVLAV